MKLHYMKQPARALKNICRAYSVKQHYVHMCTSYLLCCSEIELPATDGSFVERLVSHTVSDKLHYFGPEMPPSSISGLKGDKAESIVVLSHYE